MKHYRLIVVLTMGASTTRGREELVALAMEYSFQGSELLCSRTLFVGEVSSYDMFEMNDMFASRIPEHLKDPISSDATGEGATPAEVARAVIRQAGVYDRSEKSMSDLPVLVIGHSENVNALRTIGFEGDFLTVE